jgi:hypothetical protein
MFGSPLKKLAHQRAGGRENDFAIGIKCGQEPGLCCKVINGPPASANHLIRQEEQRWRHGDPQCLSGLEVDDQLELRGLLHGEVARFRVAGNFMFMWSSA